ncbi:IclR family transcriptional regulator [Acinetobacter schindleri]|uniref:IclR family transcriptional regulator n=1 Tax=Acinetobacter schindleri TaxID=108981 RepID=UPI003D019160
MKINAYMQDETMNVEEEKLQGGVQSLEVGLTVLDALTEHNAPMMLKELSEVLSMHPAKVHRYVVSLIRKGYAQQLSDGRYGLGERAHAFGVNALKRTDMLELTQKYIAEIQQHLNCSIHVSKWFADGAVVVQSLESNHVFNIITRVGSRMPLLKSATGRLHACLQPEHIIKPLLEKEWASSAKADQYPANWEEFLQLKEQILQQGYASVTGDMMAGIHAVAIPVYNFSRQLDHVITCIGTEDQLPADQMQQAIDYLLGIQKQIDALFNPEVTV